MQFTALYEILCADDEWKFCSQHQSCKIFHFASSCDDKCLLFSKRKWIVLRCMLFGFECFENGVLKTAVSKHIYLNIYIQHIQMSTAQSWARPTNKQFRKWNLSVYVVLHASSFLWGTRNPIRVIESEGEFNKKILLVSSHTNYFELLRTHSIVIRQHIPRNLWRQRYTSTFDTQSLRFT